MNESPGQACTAQPLQLEPAHAGGFFQPAMAVSTAAGGASVLDYRQRLLASREMLSTEDAAKLIGASRMTINKWIAKGRAIGLTQAKRGFKLPRWQFEPEIWSAIPVVSKALKTVDGWIVLEFMETTSSRLDGKSPRQAIESGDVVAVIQLAAHAARRA